MTTIPWKTSSGHDIYLDLFHPIVGGNPPDVPRKVPAVVYFHGGGMTVGNRKSWFPTWMQKRITDAGFAFISTDYRLIPPATGFEIVKDIRDLFAFMSTDDGGLGAYMSHAGLSWRIDPNCIAVAGSSAGGLCTYLAAIHASPRPKAILSMYGMGGDFLTPHYIFPKDRPFFRGREILEPVDFKEYLYPDSQLLPLTSDSALAYHDATYAIPGYPANPRMLLARLYLQLGTYLDYYTGMHVPSVSAQLRVSLEGAAAAKCDPDDTRATLASQIPGDLKGLFPQLNISSAWPATFLCHGSADTAVPVQESSLMYRLLARAGVLVQLEIAEGKEHSFDYEPDAEVQFGGLFDKMAGFLVDQLSGPGNQH